MLYALRPLQYGNLVEGSWEDVGGGRVHALAAASERTGSVDDDGKSRPRHAAEGGIAVGAAFANDGEPGDVL